MPGKSPLEWKCRGALGDPRACVKATRLYWSLSWLALCQRADGGHGCMNVLGHKKQCPQPWAGITSVPFQRPDCCSCPGGRVGSAPAGIAPALGESRARPDGFGWLRGSSRSQGQDHLWQSALRSIVPPGVLDWECAREGRQAGVLSSSVVTGLTGTASQCCWEKGAMLLVF